MKKKSNMIAALFAATLLGVIAAIAGTVYNRDTVTLSTSAGTATWTNTELYAGVEIKRISIVSDIDAGSTVTVRRIITGENALVYTNTLGTIVAAAGIGTLECTNRFLKQNDKISFANSTATGAVVVIDYLVQKH
jgi:hypothetical protein